MTGTASASRVWSDLDLEAEGRQQGYFRVPFSTHESGYGWIPIPFVAFNTARPGPRILLMAGNHGDEYEGQVMLMKLARRLSFDEVAGRLLIVPAANFPAVQAGRRTSPLDGGNLNRLFPGDPNGSPTAMIAHFIASVLVPGMDYVFDFHSGGSSLNYLPLAHVIDDGDPGRAARSREILSVFAMPVSVIVAGLMGADQRLFGACQRAGALHLSTELGGGGSLDIASLRRAEQGLTRLLHHIGTLPAALADAAAPPTTFLRRQPTRDFLYAPQAGLFEPTVTVGATVSADQPAGTLHDPAAPWREATELAFAQSGVVLCRRHPARTEIGDCLFALGTHDHPDR